ncbi:hypothetical protein BU26DRAFT_432960 [Trematosphaeria pertusa]|uniref:Uncharacterized protein n=1 Tax=Trematosphaeria pertusa TaxID=390896 RepID=A0A6A6I5I5_9PLEO|nr:uncharacterized protein BU26DRAFT_432960 [Trematosphaeria pertusa]KAF2245308.1 hypothetical protein BU26DRAFT_432960 [Trematosphaeria pertusa]
MPVHFDTLSPPPKKTKTLKPGRGSEHHDKLLDSPSPNLHFPHGSITVAEIACFLPQWYKSWDVIDRAISNGGTAAIIARLINTCRDMPNGKITSNTMYRMMKTSIEKRALQDEAYKGWCVSSHVVPEDWDATSVSVAGFRIPYQTHPFVVNRNKSPDPVPFKDLTVGVKQMPTGFDALDLTRCVKYHLEHDGEEWNFPDDFEALINVLGGPTPLHPEHYDNAVFNRWSTTSSRCATVNMFRLPRDTHGRLLKPTHDEIEGDFTDHEESDEGVDYDELDGDSGSDTGLRHSQRVRATKRVRILSPEDSDDSPLAKRRRLHPTAARRVRANVDEPESSAEDPSFKGSKRAQTAGRKMRRESSGRRSARFSGSYRVGDGRDEEMDDGSEVLTEDESYDSA